MAVIRAAYKDIIDMVMGVIGTLTMLVGLVAAGVLCYQAITGDMPGDDLVYVCTMDGDKMRCVKEER